MVDSAVMRIVEKYLPPMPRAITGDRARDAWIAALESGAKDALAESGARADVVSRLLERLDLATRGVGPLHRLASDGPREDYLAVFPAIAPRAVALDALTRAALAHRVDPRVEPALLALFEGHPWSEVRYRVGVALVETGASRGTFESMSRAMDLEDPYMVWVRNVGVAAAVRVDVNTAYDRLHARFESVSPAPTSELRRGLFNALRVHGGQPLDPRWLPLVLGALQGPDAGVAATCLLAHHDDGAVNAIQDYLATRIERGFEWAPAAGGVVRAWNDRRLASVIVRCVEAGLARTDERLTGPLGVLEALADASVLPALRALEARATGSARDAIKSVATSLAPKGVPVVEPVAVKPVAKSRTRSRATPRDADAERKVLRDAVAGVGLSDERVTAVERLIAEQVTVTLRKRDDLPVGASRFGGRPDLPPGASWPEYRASRETARTQCAYDLDESGFAERDGEVFAPLAFVAQIACADLARLGTRATAVLPSTGLLSFFVRAEITVDDAHDLSRLACAIRWFDGDPSRFERAPWPVSLPPDWRHRPAKPTFSVRAVLPPPNHHAVERLALVEREYELYEQAYAQTTGALHRTHAMLGPARAGYHRGLPPPGHTLVLQVTGDGATGFVWGDESSIFFVIGDSALAASAFDDAMCLADE